MEQTEDISGRGGERPSRLRGNTAVGLGDEDSRDNAERFKPRRVGGGAEKEGRPGGLGGCGVSGTGRQHKGQTALSRSPMVFGRVFEASDGDLLSCT